MTIKEESKWEPDVYLIKTTDVVEGGVDGISNKQAQQLANRTLYLKEQYDGIAGKIEGVEDSKEQIGTLSQQYSHVSEQLSGLSEKITGLEGLNSAYSTLSTQVGGFSEKIMAIETLNSQLSEQVKGIQSGEGNPNAQIEVSVIAGRITNRATLPLPQGFEESQCKWMLCLDDISYSSLQGIKIDVQYNRIVEAKYMVSSSWRSTTARYMVIGVKNRE